MSVIHVPPILTLSAPPLGSWVLILSSVDELAPWWMPRHRMTNAYISEYRKHFPEDKPVDDFHDRGQLYGL